MTKRHLIHYSQVLVLVAFFVSSLVPLMSAQTASAAPAGWNAGNIIDDGVFVDRNAMTPSDIQKFLENKVPVCDTDGTKPSEYGGGTRAQWGQAHYGQSKFICLRDYTENGKKASQIIYDKAQQYTINPQVLLVILQKEQGLVTDTWPLNTQYRTATGYGCPDTAPCDSQYYGLTNQLNQTGKMFRAIMNNVPQDQWYTPYVVGNNYIRYSPTSSCGGSNVNIQNRATQALYNYTPYQPNQGALDAGWGTAPCGAYGNRNFYLYFVEWFGSTRTPAYAWAPYSLNIWDESKSWVMPTDFLHKNERQFVELKVQNIGSSTWTNDGNNPVMLGTIYPDNHNSKYCDVLWPSCNRAAKLKEASVGPGGIGTFEFYIHAPAEGGRFWEYFMPLAEGKAWMNNYKNFSIYVNSGDTYDWSWLGYGAWTDSTKSTPVNIDDLARSQNIYIELKVWNKSATIWRKSGPNGAFLGTDKNRDHESAFFTGSWLSKNRAAIQKEATIRPGEFGTFEFNVKAPDTIGARREFLAPVLDYGWGAPNSNHIYLNSKR